MPANNTTTAAQTPSDLIRAAAALLDLACQRARASCSEDESHEIFQALGDVTLSILKFEAGELAIETAIEIND